RIRVSPGNLSRALLHSESGWVSFHPRHTHPSAPFALLLRTNLTFVRDFFWGEGIMKEVDPCLASCPFDAHDPPDVLTHPASSLRHRAGPAPAGPAGGRVLWDKGPPRPGQPLLWLSRAEEADGRSAPRLA